MAGALLGRVDYYDSSKEEWTQYVERLEHFFAANGVDTDAKKLSILSRNRTSCIQSAAQPCGTCKARRKVVQRPG